MILKKISSAVLVILCFLVLSGAGFGQRDSGVVLVQGQPPLTQEMVNRLEAIYNYLLDIKLTREQHNKFQQGVIAYWTKNDRAAIQETLSNLKFAGRQDELTSLRDSSQQVFVESLRRDSGDEVAQALIEAYDVAHPGRQQATRPRGFADLLGVWKRDDALLADRTPGGTPVGVSYTDSGTLEIQANGRYKLVKAHNHCSGNCCTLTGSTEYGMVSVEGTKLLFHVQSGSEMVKDGCNPSLNHQGTIKPHQESGSWTIRSNPNNNAQTLCWSTSSDAAVCYEKQ